MLSAQPRFPRGMYWGGNQLVYAGSLRDVHVTGLIVDSSGAAIPRARIQLQIQGSDKILRDAEADETGRFRLPRLPKRKLLAGNFEPRLQSPLLGIEHRASGANNHTPG